MGNVVLTHPVFVTKVFIEKKIVLYKCKSWFSDNSILIVARAVS